MENQSNLNAFGVKNYNFKSMDEEEKYFSEKVPGRKEEEMYYYENISNWFKPIIPVKPVPNIEIKIRLSYKNRILNSLFNLCGGCTRTNSIADTRNSVIFGTGTGTGSKIKPIKITKKNF